MFSTKYPNNIRTVSGLNVAVYNTDVVLSVNTSTTACSINLDLIPAGFWSTTWKLYIYDNNNNASVNNITINAGGTQKINNSSSLVISTNGGACLIQILNNDSFVATLNTVSAGGGVSSVSATSPITSSGGSTPVISTSVNTNKLIGRGSPGIGAMEEITIGSGLAFAGNTLSATGGGGGITSLNTLTAATQTMVVGTANTDFTITSGTSTHTFDLPTASAVNRGALSTIDWANFNGKLSSAYVTIQDESSSLTQRSIMNFLGTSITAVDDGLSKTNITVQAYNTITDEGGSPLTQRSVLNFVGNGVVAVDDTTRTNVTISVAVIQNTVYVMKSGSDSTGLVERFDKPFLTITAARVAALAYYTSRTENERVKIIVESGLYTEGIIIYDFIDYDLGNSVIAPTALNVSCIADTGSSYTPTTVGKFTSMIYGNATFNSENILSPPSTYYGLGIESANSTNLNLYLQCNQINTMYYDAIYMKTGKATVYANYIYNSVGDTNFYNVIRLSSGASNPPTLQVFNAVIYNNQTSGLVLNSCVFFENSSGSAVNKCMLTNCQLGSYSSSNGAISCGVNNALGIGQITLNNTTIFTNLIGIPALTDGFTAIGPTNSFNILRTYANGVNARYPTATAGAIYVNVGSGTIVGTVVADADVIFNQGNQI